MSSQNIPPKENNIRKYLEINWTSGNEKIDDFIQKRKLKINNYDDIVLEWIPYNQFNEIKETVNKNGLITVYSAIWKDGPLHKKYKWSNYTRDLNKKVALKCLHNSQEYIDSLINEAKKYPTIYKAFQVLYGISQNPDTGDYILVRNNYYDIWTSGNDKIDNFIQERQLKIHNYDDIVLEWIPYNQFNEIKETVNKNGLITVYSAIWKDGPLHKKYKWSNYTRDSNKKVALKCLHNSQEYIDSLINEAKKYPTRYKAFQVLYGISQNPDTGDYILVLVWASGNEKIDNFIQERQLKIHNYDDIVLEWIPYNQFNEIKETVNKNSLITVYSAIWKDGPLYYNNEFESYTKDSNKNVMLKYLHNSQESIDSLINEVKKYPTNYKVLYGISQNPKTGNYILVLVWASGNEKIDNFIQERQLKIHNHDDIVLEWIPYNQFNEIKETVNKNGLITVYSAICKDGPLQYNYIYRNYTRNSNKEVALKCLNNSQESIDFLINEANKYSTNHSAFQVLYGISQNPDTGNYILVQNSCINLANQISGNEKIDDFIQERQLKISNYNDIVLEWIPYNQFNEIKETGKNGLITVYLAIWKDGPLHKMYKWSDYTRDSNKKVALKCLHNSQEYIDSLINEAKKYPTRYKAFQVLYGISQNPDTGDYILVLVWASGNEKIDNFIQERQLKIHNYDDIVFEWIPYNQFNEIKETVNKNSLITVYSAIWKDGPLYYNNEFESYTKDSNKNVMLKYLHNSQESIDSLINEVKKYPTNYKVLYGISQNPKTGDYILVFVCASGNEKIDNFIQERQLKIHNHDDIVLEWIPYNQFNEIKETVNKNGLITVYSAIWKDGPLYKRYEFSNYHIRDSNKKVALKYLHNSQESIDFLINEAKKYPTKHKSFQVLYGISQNPDTGDYILIQSYTINLANWISGNEKIDDLIQEMQLKINNYSGVVFEWIPYNQFNNIKEVGKGGFALVYSANWKNGPLEYDTDNKIYKRNPNVVIALKCLHNSQNISNKFLNEIQKNILWFSNMQKKAILIIG
ncbi:uncharacterized protein OCT59_009704 [Rhizophagus irregularis]|uniref:uncharacterized protein n=1 Tax=Rhizophagus irregularis TaxID=588596 RepID=UPI00332BB7C5|nr:hypothetical protein OCT59_009704 [Rhizophagus irregularis]